MARPPRIIIPNFLYHVLNRGNNKEKVFFEDEDYYLYLKEVKKYKEKFGLKIYHYCLMPNHEHFLVEPFQKQSLPKFMHGVTLVHTQYMNKKYGRMGHVWQGRYKSPLVEKEDYMIQCGYYIEDNPRRAGLVKRLLEDWPWSSYHFYAYWKEDPIVDVDPYYLGLGTAPEERQENYRKFIIGVQDEKWLKNIREKLDQGILGSEKFIEEIKEKFKIKLIRVGERGRPPKNGT